MRSLQFTMAILLCSVVGPAMAGDPDAGHGRGWFCRKCSEPCFPKVSKEKETRYCWDVDTKTICIPRVRFPWEHCSGKGGKSGCSAPLCGQSKPVKILMKCEYERGVCEYDWEQDQAKSGYGRPDVAPQTQPHDDPEESSEPEVPPPPPIREARQAGSTYPAHRVPTAPLPQPRNRLIDLIGR